MKDLRLFLMLAVLAIAGIAMAANDKLVVQDMSMEAGSSVTLDVALENETTNLMGFQCDIVLPEGLTLKLKNNGKPAATLGDRFEDTEHGISSSVTSSGAYRFIATSLDGEAIPGTSGTLFTVTLQADALLAPGTTLESLVKNIEFNTQDNQKLTFDNVSFIITIPGDTPPDPDPDPEPVKKNRLVVQDISMEAGSSVTLDVTLKNDITNLMGFQCDIVLPEGLTLKLKNNGKPAATLGSRFEDTGHSISSSVTSSGAYRFIATSLDGEAIPDTCGTLFTVTLQAGASLAAGTTLEGSVKNIEFNTQDNQKVVFDEVIFNVSIPKDEGTSEVTVINCTREYGEANPTFEYTVEGIDLVGTPEITCDATPSSPVGTYDIVISQGTVTNSNVTYINGTLTITKAPLTIKAGDYTKKEGEAMPEFVPTFEGFKNNETSEVLIKQPVISCEAEANTIPGEYEVTVSGAEAQNYDITYVNGKLTITDLLVQTLDLTELPTMTYGDEAYALPQQTTEGLTLTWSVGDATIANIIDNNLTILKAGTTNVTATQTGDENYKPFGREFTLTIVKAMLTITANNCTKQVGEENPELTVSYAGFKYNDDSSSLTTQPTITTTATIDSPAGTYPIVANGAESDNYDFTYEEGTLTVTAELGSIITFVDETVKDLCVATWDMNGDGELNTGEAEAVIDLGAVFSNSEIVSFDELTYFTGLTSIGDNAFSGCSNLWSITIPENVTTIGAGAFKECSSLTSITILKSITSLGDEAFASSGLSSITIPNSVTTIGVRAFYGCNDLTTVKLGSGVRSIGDETFAYCENLSSIKMGKNISSIGQKAFRNCRSLASVTLPDVLNSIGDGAFQNTSLTSVNIPYDVETIGNDAFRDCASLVLINFDEDIYGFTIGNNAFRGCAFTSIVIPDDCVEEIGEYAFAYNVNLNKAVLGEGIMEIETGLFQGCSSLSSVVIPDDVCSIGNQAFADCDALTSIKLPEYLTSLGENVFPSSMKSIELPNSFTAISEGLFSDNNFQYIKLGNKMKSIAKNAFGSIEPVIEVGTSTPPTIASDAFPNVEYLSDINVIVPNAAAETAYRRAAVWNEMTFSNQNNVSEVTVDTPGDLSFELIEECGVMPAKVVGLKVNGTINADDFKQMLVNMKSLLRLDLSDCNITAIPDDALNGKTQLKELILPTGLQTIGKNAFKGCIYLTDELDLPSTVTSIGESAFVGTDYTSVKLPSALKTIGDYAFNNVPLKQKLSLPNRVTSVGAYAFAGTQINGLTIYDGVTSIGDGAFAGTPIQGHVAIPDGVTCLGEGAFKNTQLSSVFLPNSITALSQGLFQGCPNLNLVYVPDNYTAMSNYAFDGCGALTILRLSANTVSMGEYSLQSTPLEYVKVPSQVEVLPRGVLKNCKSLESLTLPANLKSMEGEALNGCTSLRNMSVEAVTPPVIRDRSTIRGINTDLCIISIPTSAYRNYVLAEYWGQFVQMRNDIAVETAGNGEIAFESVNEEEEEESEVKEYNGLPAAARHARRRAQLATDEESMTYANNGSSVYVPQQGKVRFYIIPAEGEEILSATLDGEDIMPYIVDGVYVATADKKNAKLVVVFSGSGQGLVQAGDVNGDGDVDIADAVYIVNYVVGKPTPAFVADAADVNGDGDVDIADAVRIVNLVVGKISSLVRPFNFILLDPQ